MAWRGSRRTWTYISSGRSERFALAAAKGVGGDVGRGAGASVEGRLGGLRLSFGKI